MRVPGAAYGRYATARRPPPLFFFAPRPPHSSKKKKKKTSRALAHPWPVGDAPPVAPLFTPARLSLPSRPPRRPEEAEVSVIFCVCEVTGRGESFCVWGGKNAAMPRGRAGGRARSLPPCHSCVSAPSPLAVPASPTPPGGPPARLPPQAQIPNHWAATSTWVRARIKGAHTRVLPESDRALLAARARRPTPPLRPLPPPRPTFSAPPPHPPTPKWAAPRASPSSPWPSPPPP